MSHYTQGVDTPYSPPAQISPMAIETQLPTNGLVPPSNCIFRSFGSNAEIWDTTDEHQLNVYSENEIEEALTGLLVEEEEQAFRIFHDASLNLPNQQSTFNPVTPLTIDIEPTSNNSPSDQFFLEMQTPQEVRPVPPRPTQMVPPIQRRNSVQRQLNFTPHFIPGASRHLTSADLHRIVTNQYDWEQFLFHEIIEYTKSTSYPLETVIEREVRSKAFADGIHTALLIFGRGGVSQSAASDESRF